MMERPILYLDAHRMTAFAWSPTGIVRQAEFDATPEGLAAFAAFLAPRTAIPCPLLCNLAEESHQVETIPYLRGKDRQTLLTRKTGQAFFGTAFTSIRSLGYEKDRRRNEKVLLSALTAPAQLQPWLNAIASAGVPLSGVFTVSQLACRLLRALVKPPPRCLLFTVQDQAIRESFLVDGTSVFSRLAPLYDMSPAGIAAAVAAEGQKLHQYLAGQRHLGRNDALAAYVVAPEEALPAIGEACAARTPLDYRLLSLAEAARRVGLKSSPEDAQGSALFAFLLGRTPPREQFAPEEARHDFAIHGLKRALLGAGAVALVAGLLLASKQFAEAYGDRSEAGEFTLREEEQRQRYQSIAATFPQLGIDNDVLRKAADRYLELRSQPAGPAELLETLSQALDANPAIELDTVEWRLSDTRNGDSALVRGVVARGAGVDPRAVLAIFESFVAALRLDPEVQVVVRQQPFDIDSSSSLKGGTREEAAAPPPGFQILISRRKTS